MARGDIPEQQPAWGVCTLSKPGGCPSPAPRTWQSQERAAAAAQGTGLCGAPAPHPDVEPRSSLANLGKYY